MEVSVSEAKGRLTELLKRAEAGEEIFLTRFGRPVARLMPVAAKPDPAMRRVILEQVRAAGARKAQAGASAARSQDFLYDERGLPK